MFNQSIPSSVKSNEDESDSVPECLIDKSICKTASTANIARAGCLTTVVDRYGTFETWPLNHIVKPYDLAKAGFIYTGYSDKVECVDCKIRLKSFEKGDIPMLEHTRWSPKCSIVRNFFKNGSI